MLDIQCNPSPGDVETDRPLELLGCLPGLTREPQIPVTGPSQNTKDSSRERTYKAGLWLPHVLAHGRTREHTLPPMTALTTVEV